MNSFRSVVSILALALTVSAAVPAFAKNARTISLPSNVVLNGTQLEGGRYTIRWESHSPTLTVSFVREKKTLATASATVVERGQRYPANEVVTDTTSDGTRVLKEIRFAGSSQAIVFSE